jgi:hypothetical protein
MAASVSKPLVWTAVIIAVIALVPIVAMTLMVAGVAWIPIVGALAICAVILLVRARRKT